MSDLSINDLAGAPEWDGDEATCDWCGDIGGKLAIKGKPVCEDCRTIAYERALETRINALETENVRLRDAMNWYEVQSAGARLIHSGGDVARANLAADGGARARAALTRKQQQ